MQHRKLTFEELQDKSLDRSALKKMPRSPVYIILENVRSLYNVGSVFRTADGLRIEQLILTGYTGRPPRKEIDKVALGAVESVPWVAYEDSSSAIRALHNRGVQVVALEQTESSIDFQEFTYRFPLAVVMGNEFDGILQETLGLCDACVEIPMLGIKQSLNVSTAFGIIGYELLRCLKTSGFDWNRPDH